MPRTEAGKRLLAMLPIIGGYQPDTQAVLIDAIEDEAATDAKKTAETWQYEARILGEILDVMYPGWRKGGTGEQFRAAIVAAERARIRAAVEGLPYWHHDGYYNGVNDIDRAAVLAIIDREDTDA